MNPVRIQFYASPDSVLDADDTLVGQTDLAPDSLNPGSNPITVRLDARAIAQPGRYTLIGVIDPDNAIAESDETNNQSIASSPLTLDFAVGQLPGRAPVPALDLTDADGTDLRLTIAGPGIARLTPNGSGYELSLSGTDAGTRIDLTGSGGDGRITLTGLNADSPLGSLAAPIASLTGVARFATVNTLNLGDIAAGARLEGNSLASLNVSRDALGDLRLTGSGVSGFVLGSAQIGGTIGGLWSVNGRANSISGESTRADWRANISSPLTQLVIRGDASGQFAASALQLLQVGGSLKAMSVRIGANLGSDAVIGGSGDAADHFGAGTLARLRVSGDIDDSLIVIGVDPHNGRYRDGDDQQLGTSTNRVQELLVGGRLTGDTQISAPAFPASVRINGVLRSPASLSELASTPPDRSAPTLTAALVNDSGTSTSDRITRDASLGGQASDAAGVTRLLAALDLAGTPPLGDLSDLSSALQPDGRFVLTPALLDALAGGTLADGAHRVRLVAADAAGNASAPVDLAFTLDTAPPTLASFTLDPASDTGTPGDRETSADIATLLGQSEPGTAVALTGSGLSTTADATGAFRFADLPLALGDNAFAIVLSDLAGNTTAGDLTVTRVKPPVDDTTAPTLAAALLADTGRRADDGITRDATITGTVSDDRGVTRLRAGFGSDPAGFVSILDTVQADGHFTLSAARLTEIHGGALPDGSYTLRLVAGDAAGNSREVDLAFTLDTTPPALASFTLDPASDTGTPGDRETSADIATLLGQSEPGTAVALSGSGLSTTADATGAFRFADLPLALGDNAFALVLSDLAGNTTAGDLTVTRVKPPVEDHTPPTLAATLLADTGRRADDGLTRDATITGTATDDHALTVLHAGFGSDPADLVSILDTLQADGHFTLSAARLTEIHGGALPDGDYTLHLVAEDAAGNATTTSVAFTLDTQAPAAPTFGLSPASDTGTLGDGDTEAARVTLVGTGEANSDLLLVDSGTSGSSSVVVNNQGSFFLPDVALTLGDNAFTLRAIDAAGNAAETRLVLHRSASQASSDAVLQWDAIALSAIRLDASAPPVATRALAMLSIAVLDTVNAFEGTPGFYVSRRAPAGASIDAAIAAAAQRVLAYLYLGQQASFDTALASALAGIADGATKNDGIALGRAIADDIIALRRGDGFDDFVDFTGSTAPGQWQETAPTYAVALLPQWADLQPFAMSSPSEFRPAPPPALDSATYTTDFAEVKALGSASGSTRSGEQTEIARFWADGAGTDTPPGHWNRIAATLATAQGNSLAANARLFA
ncbi:hypothetical protein E4Q08_02485 [Candidatus Accumulibacter phosphatis]|uniref:Uncharacterized protein n=1 Tax=Candidatus Accumulibacter contiguus TaxID=2954381 RepID=A0ABX1T3I3_9PROT|nr:Ig-like domain-containing protein [Candidatus Accumulibacter contiguus]NMQ04207.1 hypothetical protein [Candidatus Accumulibacter contiguus]